MAYGNPTEVACAIRSVRVASEVAGILVKVVVVDNFPATVYSDAISRLCDLYIARQDNPGFGAACNSGIREGLSAFPSVGAILLLNADARVEDSFFLELNRIPISTRRAHPIVPAIVYDQDFLAISGPRLQPGPGEFSRIHDPQFLFSVRQADGSTRPRGEFFDLRFDEYLLIKEKDLGKVSSLTRISSIIDGGVGDANLLDLSAFEVQQDFVIQNLGIFVGPTWQAGDDYDGIAHSAVTGLSGQLAHAWCGAAVVLPANYFEKVGWFNERYFLYYEDVELSLRGKGHGFYPRIFPSLIVRHKHSSTTNRYPIRKTLAITKSRSMFSVMRNGPIVTVLLILSHLLEDIRASRNPVKPVRDFLYSLGGFFLGLLPPKYSRG